jgi:hypothetical protein
MDGTRFDALTKGLAKGLSRRAMLRGLAGSLMGAVGLAAAGGADAQRGGLGCPEGSEKCRGQCLTPDAFQADPKNCGACGVRCEKCEVCSGGACVSNGDPCCGVKCTGRSVCDGGVCVPPPCSPRCQGKECGDDGCGGSCGSCPDGYLCRGNGKCACAESCGGSVCGVDSCGNSCGTCGIGQTCDGGQCVDPPTTTLEPVTTTPEPVTTTTTQAPAATTTEAPTTTTSTRPPTSCPPGTDICDGQIVQCGDGCFCALDLTGDSICYGSAWCADCSSNADCENDPLGGPGALCMDASGPLCGECDYETYCA